MARLDKYTPSYAIRKRRRDKRSYRIGDPDAPNHNFTRVSKRGNEYIRRVANRTKSETPPPPPAYDPPNPVEPRATFNPNGPDLDLPTVDDTVVARLKHGAPDAPPSDWTGALITLGRYYGGE